MHCNGHACITMAMHALSWLCWQYYGQTCITMAMLASFHDKAFSMVFTEACGYSQTCTLITKFDELMGSMDRQCERTIAL
eukprot:1157041-Pelagomonas_calceolata.AAC.1